jgi:CRISPR-associated protein Csb1
MPEHDNKPLVDRLLEHDRVIIEASLTLANGNFFQPTGFPDIGACVFVDKAGRRRCLVESEQSMANRLEAVCMQPPGTWRAPFAGKLPILRVSDASGGLLATNLTEPHRLSSSYVLEGTLGNGSKLQDVLRDRLGVSTDGKRWPLDKRSELSRVVFALDPAAMLHGFQFMQWSAVGLRQQRLLHARMEAVLAGDADVHYGMVKVDAIEPESSSQKMGNKGQSIAHKARLVPDSISATFEIDVMGLRERRLVAEEAQAGNLAAQKFLLALALWKIRQFLADQPAFDARTGQVERSLRLRSDCSLMCSGVAYRTQSNGGAYGPDVPVTLDEFVRIDAKENRVDVLPLFDPPDFVPLLKSVTDQDALEINVQYVPAAPKPSRPQDASKPSGPDQTPGADLDEDEDADTDE